MIVGHANPTEFTSHATPAEHTHGPCPLPPVVVIVRTGACDIHTYWSGEQAREFAAELLRVAEQVDPLYEKERT